MTYETPITETDLHAYIDGQLSEQRRKQVEVWLEEHPDVMREMQDYQAIDQGIHTLFDSVLVEPVPEHLQVKTQRRFQYRIAAAAAWMALGATLSWGINHFTLSAPQQLVQEQLVKPASFAHYVYATDVKRPVEVSAADGKSLVKWLSNRMNTTMIAPDLTEMGYDLIGGRLLPSTDRMAAQFMYSNLQGNRITLYIRHVSSIKVEPAFHITNEDEITTLYWIENDFGYAISGQFDKQQLIRIAETTHQQLKLAK